MPEECSPVCNAHENHPEIHVVMPQLLLTPQGMSKNALKKAAKQALKPKKEKDPNWWVTALPFLMTACSDLVPTAGTS